ncbi:hypothetical protein PR048_020855 [Dryococelus australis]|uniref:Uncharacterized protein n=1 Tax=Dryococelus australis TaxID=614101 RepID=A0ABQ9GWL3_9NEOP|nr:hypothetical protein PR048_020855 [Dryococelus australis]
MAVSVWWRGNASRLPYILLYRLICLPNTAGSSALATASAAPSSSRYSSTVALFKNLTSNAIPVIKSSSVLLVENGTSTNEATDEFEGSKPSELIHTSTKVYKSLSALKKQSMCEVIVAVVLKKKKLHILHQHGQNITTNSVDATVENAKKIPLVCQLQHQQLFGFPESSSSRVEKYEPGVDPVETAA